MVQFSMMSEHFDTMATRIKSMNRYCQVPSLFSLFVCICFCICAYVHGVKVNKRRLDSHTHIHTHTHTHTHAHVPVFLMFGGGFFLLCIDPLLQLPAVLHIGQNAVVVTHQFKDHALLDISSTPSRYLFQEKARVER